MPRSVNNERYYRNISESLNWLVTMIRQDNRRNIQSLNIHAEAFFAEFLNALYGWDLINANAADQNAPGIDLWYAGRKVIAQVSSTYTHKKIQGSLDKSTDSKYDGSQFYFVAITEKTQKYDDFNVPEGITFNKDTDVLDMDRLLNKVLNAGIEKQKVLSDLVDKYFGAADVPQHFLTDPPGDADSSKVICREKELEDIVGQLRAGEKSILLMNGFGGVGKTALARLVFHTVQAEYDEVAWISYRGSLRQSLLASILLKGDIQDDTARWNAIRAILDDRRKKLLVIDNADHEGEQNPQEDPDLKKLTGWPNTSVLVTSRLVELEGYQPYDIDFLGEDACVELFYLHYKNDPDRAQLAAVKKLVKLAQYHTLTVELFAKGARREMDLDAYYESLYGSLDSVEREFTTEHTGKMATIEGHLRGLFVIQGRSDAEKETLRAFAVLPPDAELTRKEAKTWFCLSGAVLERLADDGWLRWDNGLYSMHPLVRQILLLDPVPEGTAAKFLEFVEDYHNGYFPEDMVYTELSRRLALARSVTEAVCGDGETAQAANILHNIGDACRQLARYGEAVQCYEKSLKIKDAVLGLEDPDTAATYNNLAGVYKAMGDYPKALEYYEKSLKIKESVLGTEHPDTATTYNNLAGVYRAMGDYPKALEYHEKARQSKESVLGTEHPSTAATYNNLALVYQAMGNNPKAVE